MESKIRIKIGPVEVEYEGSEAFLKKELLDILKTVTEYSRSMGAVAEHGEDKADNTNKKVVKLSTKSIAAKLSASSGQDIVIAATAHLALVKQQDVFSRQQILKEMQTASGYYKTSYGANLSGYLKTLLKNGTLTEPSTGNLSLSAKARKDLGGRLD